MGNFYTSLTARGAGRDEVVGALGNRHAFVAAIGDDVVVFDEECEEQDLQVLEAVGAQLSRLLGCPVLGALNHDDDVLCVQLHRDGESVIDYDSSPGYFDGEEQPPSAVNVEALCEALGAAASVGRVHAILASDDDDEFLFALDRHKALVEALGLPIQAVGYGFSRIAEGELPPGLDFTHLVEVGADA